MNEGIKSVEITIKAAEVSIPPTMKGNGNSGHFLRRLLP